MLHEREKSADNGRLLSADKNLSSDIKSDDFPHCQTFFADIVGKLLYDWLTAGAIATTCKQRDSRNHSDRYSLSELTCVLSN